MLGLARRISHDFHVRFLALLWMVENESLYDSCDNRGTGGARKRADGTRQWWWWYSYRWW